jgi:S1-C subfamily serine protease
MVVPAAGWTSGLRPGDLTAAVDGRPASSITLPAVRDDLQQWPAGSIITLRVITREKARNVAIELRDLL